LPRQIFTFDPPERFVVGTVGQPGERTFYLQAKQGEHVISVALEKIQAQVLAERLDELLDEVRRRGGEVPTVAPTELDDVSPLDQPLLEEFRVGTMALAWDGDAGVVIIEAHAQTEEPEGEEPAEDRPAIDVPDDAEEGPDVLRVRIDPAYAKAFVKRALRVVAAGRPPCPLCGLPLDPEGHVCPRQNGHRQ
jgi:uncharacterized repeat protein (TIGR03847 family)